MFEQLDLFGRLCQVIAVRGTFDMRPWESLAIAATQTPFVWADEYVGLPEEGGLYRQADFIPYKPATDVTVRGHSYAPEGRAAPLWMAGLRVLDRSGQVRAETRLNVHGPRFWRRKDAAPGGYELTPGQPAEYVPLDWRWSFGGRLAPTRAGGEAPWCMDNPVGVGMPGWNGASGDYPAPQIESALTPVADPARTYAPANLAPIPPAWRPRQRHAGTYDEAWRRSRHPLLPQDFDYRFYNCAPAETVVTPFLSGDETVQLLNLDARMSRIDVALPGLRLEAIVQERTARPLRLDGVHIDADRGMAELTWRNAYVNDKSADEAVLRFAGSGG